MHPDVQAFVDKWAEKTSAKQMVLVALGAAKAAEAQGLDASEHWAAVEMHGFANGAEGRLYAEAFALAEAYVESHPEQFALVAQYAGEGPNADERHKALVEFISGFRERRADEEVAKLTMFELVSFERQHIGGGIHIKSRKVNSRGVKRGA